MFSVPFFANESSIASPFYVLYLSSIGGNSELAFWPPSLEHIAVESRTQRGTATFTPQNISEAENRTLTNV